MSIQRAFGPFLALSSLWQTAPPQPAVEEKALLRWLSPSLLQIGLFLGFAGELLLLIACRLQSDQACQLWRWVEGLRGKEQGVCSQVISSGILALLLRACDTPGNLLTLSGPH